MADGDVPARPCPLCEANRMPWWQGVLVGVAVLIVGSLVAAPVAALVVAMWRAVLHG